ncbi:ATP-binding cassette domain-containing protein [Peptoniphilus sp. GNH]|nr:ATP-binding cassette domain-containing protein [Peptoniphilus sp. GNH]
MTEILKFENISKTFEIRNKGLLGKKRYKKALDQVSFSINEGEIFGLVGESGSGKSTLGKIAMGLFKPSSGKVFYKGKDIWTLAGEDYKNYKNEVQMVFQDPYSSLNPQKTVGWSIMEILNIQKIGKPNERIEKAKNILREVELEESLLDQYPSELSGGQRQRISIASALIVNPKLVIIDEGVSALDVSIQAQVLNLLNELQKKYNFTSIFISHDLNVIEYLCGRIAVLENGVLQEVFDADEVMSDDRKDYTKKLFNSVKEKLR